jgi:hypothetical protein
MKLKDCINNLTHSLLQQGPSMRERSLGPPPNAVNRIPVITCLEVRATLIFGNKKHALNT